MAGSGVAGPGRSLSRSWGHAGQEKESVRTRKVPWRAEQRTGDSSQADRFLVVRRDVGPPEVGLGACFSFRLGFKINKFSKENPFNQCPQKPKKYSCSQESLKSIFFFPPSFGKRFRFPKLDARGTCFPTEGWCGEPPGSGCHGDCALSPSGREAARALAERRAGRGWSRTPASSAQNLLSTCVGRGYPGRSYPSGRESAPGEPEPPQRCDGRGAGTEDRTEVGVRAGDVILPSSPHPNEASISRKSRPTTLTKMFVPCVRISQCSAP